MMVNRQKVRHNPLTKRAISWVAWGIEGVVTLDFHDER